MIRRFETAGAAMVTTIAVVCVLFGAVEVLAQEPAPPQPVEYVPGEVIVKLRGSAKAMRSQAFIGKSVSERSMTLKGSWSGINLHHFQFKSKVKPKPRGDGAKASSVGVISSASAEDSEAVSEMEAVLQELRQDPDVEFAEPNYILRTPGRFGEEAVISFNEARASAANQASSSSYGTLAQTGSPIDAKKAWSVLSATDEAPIVAIIDTGVDINHEFLRDSGSIWINKGEIPGNGIDDDGNGFIDDVYGWNFVAGNGHPLDDDGHGTHVAGIVLGTTQDILAWPVQPAKIQIMPLKFLDSEGMGTTSDAVKAIYYAVNNGAKVLNNSWGGGGFSNALATAISYSYSKRVAFVAAAGNSALNNDVSPTYPAGYQIPSVISVAATTDMDSLAVYSNYGSHSVHMGAPGTSIWSSLPNQRYGRLSGTSMATPFVAGLAAMMLRENPDLSAHQIKELIFAGAEPIPSLQTKTVTRARMNAYKSIVLAQGTTGNTNQPAFENVYRSVASEGAAGGAGCGLVKTLIDDARGPSGPQRNVAFFGLLLLFATPILIALSLRSAQTGKARRRFPRYQIASQVKMMVGDRELTGHVSSISMGGLQMATDPSCANDPSAWLENGGVVSMTIQSPDGKEEIKVAGKVVWSEEKKRYGVAFEGADTSVLNSIGRWTAGLMKSS
ncbi:MAG: S8 family serine peptidase [Bdellovibrionales bacterium]|jgi:subtilisin family serine protease|nr:S8 family serine peptidase [Bdellovibrionales bacterium]